MTKASVAQTAGHMTGCLMSVTRMMSQQVKMSEETIGTLGKWPSMLYFELPIAD